MVAGQCGMVLLGMAMVAGFGDLVSPTARLSERVVARVAVGSAADQVSNRDCTGREGFCSAGFVFAGEADTLYFYDLFHDNLKVLPPFPAGDRIAVLGGLGAGRTSAGLPVDGFHGADGHLYLRTSSGGTHPRQQTWRREAIGQWRPVTRPVEWSDSRGDRAPMRRPANSSRGIFLGVDGAGNRYYEKRGSWSTAHLEMYDARDRLVAVSELPERPIWKAVSGRGEKWVGPRGGVFEVYVSERWMVVTHWTADG